MAWQEFTLATWAHKVTITCESGPGFWAVDGMGAADEQAVGANRQPVYQDAPQVFNRRPNSRQYQTQSIFVAAQTETITVTIMQETE